MASFLRRVCWVGALFVSVAVRGELLVLYPGLSGAGAGVVGRMDPATGAALPAFGHDNEGMYALCVDRTGDIYVSADVLGAGLIYRFGRNGEFRGKIAEVAGADFHGLAFGPDGKLYALAFMADAPDSTTRHTHVVRFPGAGAPGDVFVAEGAGGMTSPRSLCFGPDGNLYIAAANGVLRFDGATGAPLDTFIPIGRGGLQDAASLAFGPDGQLYVASTRGNSVARFEAKSGQYIDTFVVPQNGGLTAPHGLAFGPEGDLYVSSQGFNHVLRFNGRSGALVSALMGDRNFRAPSALAFAPAVATAEVTRPRGSGLAIDDSRGRRPGR